MPSKSALAANMSADTDSEWKYLAPNPKRETVDLFVCGTRLAASRVYDSMLDNGYTVEAAAGAWDIPVEAVLECIRFSELHEAELSAEAADNWRRAEARGVQLEPPADV